MIARHAAFCLLSLGLALAAPAARAMEIVETVSPGGLTAWLVEDHSIPFTALTLSFRGGASLDAPGKRGATNLMTHTLEEGAGDLDATGFAEALEATGGVLRFDVGDDALTVTARLLTDSRDDTAELVRMALVQPRFDEDAIDRVRGQVEAVIRSEATDPQAIATKALARSMWGGHPYGSSTNGTLDSVARLGRTDLLEAAGRVLARDRVIIGAAGDITAEELGVLVDRMLGDLPATAAAPLPQPAALAPAGEPQVIEWDSPQTVLRFAQAAPEMDDPDYFPAFVANHILGGGGFSSRLMEEIREKRGLTYGVSTALVNGVYGSSWVGGLASNNASAGEALDLVRAEWQRMADGVSERELADAKTYLTGEYALRWDGNSKIASILAGMQLIGLPRDYPLRRNDLVEAVTAEDVAELARTRLDADKLHVVMVGRPEGL